MSPGRSCRNKGLKCRDNWSQHPIAPHFRRGAFFCSHPGRSEPLLTLNARDMKQSTYLEELARRVLVYDGAMGTSIQTRPLTAEDFGGPGLDGCNDHLVITRPDLIRQIHGSFLDVGCDVVETNTFRSNRLTLGEYGLGDRVVEINRAAALVARSACADYATPDRPRFVAGSIGPSGFLPSTSDPSLGAMTYEALVDIFAEQAGGLLEGGVDVLLVETSQDMLEVKAQVTGCRRALADAGRSDVGLQVQVTLDTSGRMLLGTDIAAAATVLEALRVDVVGLNCSTGPEHMREPVRWLAENCRLPISVIPNAGIPHNEAGVAVYPLEPEALAEAHEWFVVELGVSIVGGCCGTTPEHMAAVVRRVEGRRPKGRAVTAVPRLASAMTAVDMQQVPAPTLIGERVNAQGSKAVKRMLLADDYEAVRDVARHQVDGGAHLLDVCVALTERQDEARQMRTLVGLLAQSVETPLVIDTTETDVVEAALRQYPGRAIINSIHLESGRDRVDRVVPMAMEHGAALIALTIDEAGMARTAERKLEVAGRIHDIVVGEYGMSPGDLVFDDLTFTLATGDAEFRASAVETIDGIRRIKAELPGVLTSLGVSNVSFGLQPPARAALNSVFLHHCVEAGLDMAIVNPAHITPYAEVDEAQRQLADDLIFDRRDDALARFIAYFEEHQVEESESGDPRLEMDPDDAIRWSILHRKKEGVVELVDQAIARGIQGEAESASAGSGPASAEARAFAVAPSPTPASHEAGVRFLNTVLLPAMKEVGDRFGAGDLILPFVLQSAEVMKAAVGRMETYLEKAEGQSKGTVVLATVYGDVHDIGKNLVHTILENNGYTVHDLGKQVPVNDIIARAQEVGADAIGLSALLVSTSKQMPAAVRELDRRGLRYPVLCGGAAINPSFVRAASFVDDQRTALYEPGVWYCKDAFAGLAVVDALLGPDREAFVRRRLEEVGEGVARRAALQDRAKAARPAERPGRRRQVDVPVPDFLGSRVIDRVPLAELYDLVDLNTLYRLHWGAKNASGQAWERLVRNEFEPRLERLKREALAGGQVRVRAAYGFWPAVGDGDHVVVGDPGDPALEVERLSFPRQSDRERLCLADYLRGSTVDYVGFLVVSVSDRLLERSTAMMKEGEYSEGYYLHGFGVRLAEAAAEWVHRRMRREWGIEHGRGLRYAWGYPACPDHMQHEVVYRLLPARERLGMDLTSAGALVPELSTAAIVFHHPDAKYFSAV